MSPLSPRVKLPILYAFYTHYEVSVITKVTFKPTKNIVFHKWSIKTNENIIILFDFSSFHRLTVLTNSIEISMGKNYFLKNRTIVMMVVLAP